MAIALTTVAFFAVAWWALRSIRARRCFWLNPLVAPITVWTLSYPVWALLNGTSLVPTLETFEVETRVYVVLFSTLFVGAMGIALRAVFPSGLRKIEPMRFGSGRRGRTEERVIHVLFATVLLSWLARWSAGLVFGLYEDFESLTHSLVENIIGELSNLVWLAFPACLIAFGVTRRKVFLVESSVLGANLLLYAVVSTSKGVIAQVAMCILMVMSALGISTLMRTGLVVALLVAGGGLFGLYSYELRNKAYFAVRGQEEYDVSRVINVLTLSSVDQLLEMRGTALIERITGYGEGLARLLEGRSADRDRTYVLGSVVEIGNLVPRVVWEERPHLSFNHYVTGAVWGQYGLLSESPIGRIGEAFYVGGWIGIVYGIVYAVAFGLIVIAWRRARESVWGAAYVVSLLIVWVFPDAYLIYHLKQTLILWVVFRLGKAWILHRQPLDRRSILALDSRASRDRVSLREM